MLGASSPGEVGESSASAAGGTGDEAGKGTEFRTGSVVLVGDEGSTTLFSEVERECEFGASGATGSRCRSASSIEDVLEGLPTMLQSDAK